LIESFIKKYEKFARKGDENQTKIIDTLTRRQKELSKPCYVLVSTKKR